MNKRIKELRVNLNLSMAEFGSHLGVTRSAISKIENAQTNVSNQIVNGICREFNVNEEWLRTGKGDMFNATGDDELSYLVGQLCGSDDEFKKEFVKTLCKLSDKQWKVLKEFVDEVYLNTKKDK